ncbi:MAG: hypothetical protein WC291_06280 [Thermodesulfovibrionales bacterium]|jgi:hypothetical protein
MNASGSAGGSGLVLALWTAVSGLLTVKGVGLYADFLADMFETINNALAVIGH